MQRAPKIRITAITTQINVNFLIKDFISFTNVVVLLAVIEQRLEIISCKYPSCTKVEFKRIFPYVVFIIVRVCDFDRIIIDASIPASHSEML